VVYFSPVKRTLVVLSVVVAMAVAVLLIIFVDNQPPAPLVETSFMGFTNTPAGPLALVAVYFRPRFDGCHWPTFEVHRGVGGEWELWTPPPGDPRPLYSFGRQPRPFPPGPNGRIINQVVTFAVGNTNDAWHLVMEVKENPPGDLPFMRRARSLWNAWRKKPQPQKHYDGHHYFITNETRAAK